MIDPMGASFTDTPSGDSDIAEFTVLNVGDQPTGPVDAFFADFSGVGDFTGLTDCLGAVLGSGASCTIVVAYENNTGHDGGGATVVADADPGGTATAAVSGVGQPDPSGNELELSPANASLSDTPDSPGTTQVFDLVNQSSGPVTQINFSVIEDAGQGSFLIAAEDCDTLLTNDQCTVTVRYLNDSGAGTRNAVLEARGLSNSSVVSTTAQLAGMGLDEPLDMSPREVPMSDTPGGPGIGGSVTVVNDSAQATGNLSVQIVDSTGAGAFSKTSDSCNGASLAPNASCTIGVEYVTSAGGSRANATLRVSGSPGGTVESYLSGRGDAGGLEVDRTGQTQFRDSPDVPGDTQDFVIHNTSATATNPITSTITNHTGTGGFSIVSGGTTCNGAVLASGQTCSIRVRYDNNTGGGSAIATLHIDGAPVGTADRQLGGFGDAGDPLEISPLTAGFADSPAAAGSTQTFTVTNQGGPLSGLLAIDVLADAGVGAFAVESDLCSGALLLPGISCTFVIRYTNDTGGGSRSAQVQVTGSPGGTVIAELVGNGQP